MSPSTRSARHRARVRFRAYHEVDGEDRSALASQVEAQLERVAQRLEPIDRVVAILSGKGGVGKSYLGAALALGAAPVAKRGVGVLDADLSSPTVARLLGATGRLDLERQGVVPALGRDGVRVVSTDLILEEGAPLRWRGAGTAPYVSRAALQGATLREFLADVAWGALDLLVVDLPPGADVIADLHAFVPRLDGAFVVTLPSDESRRSVARTMRAARLAGIPLLGIVENMSGYACARCAASRPLFAGDAGAELEREFAVPLLGRVPFYPLPDGTGPKGSPAVSPRLPGEVLTRMLEAVR